MTEPTTRPGRSDHDVDADDERRHRPDPEQLWNESYYLDFVDGTGEVAGYVRIGLYPNLSVTWWTAMVVGPDRPTVASVAYDLPVPAAPGVAATSGGGAANGGYDMTCTAIAPLETMTVEGVAPATVLGDPADAYRGGDGVPTTVGLDLTWTTDGRPYHYGLTTRYEVPCLVEGEVTVGDERIPVRGQGQRDHSWGVRDWWAFGWCWAAARLDDGTRVHFADIRIPGHPVAFGYLQAPGGGVQPVESLVMTEDLGADGFPTGGSAQVGPGGMALEISPLAFGPLLLVAPDGRTSRFPRALARFTAADGRRGTGWIEWNQPG